MGLWCDVRLKRPPCLFWTMTPEWQLGRIVGQGCVTGIRLNHPSCQPAKLRGVGQNRLSLCSSSALSAPHLFSVHRLIRSYFLPSLFIPPSHTLVFILTHTAPVLITMQDLLFYGLTGNGFNAGIASCMSLLFYSD